MQNKFKYTFFILIVTLPTILAFKNTDLHKDIWGFFGHRKINRQAVFSLPPDMLVFYKKNIEYITDHAVDPDKRRYATKHEAVRHYIDLDVWGKPPFANVPRDWSDMLIKFTQIYVVNSKGDTLKVNARVEDEEVAPTDFVALEKAFAKEKSTVDMFQYQAFFWENVQSQYYEDEWMIDCDSISKLVGYQVDCTSAFANEHFTEDGIVPYHLVSMQARLTKAFEDLNAKKILQLSAEFGHYIGDAHVPLHTTENYNGHLSNQRGIHAFWESRIPELFADEDYDFWVGKAEYIEDPQTYYWDVVLTSHSYVDSVLLIEADLFSIMGDRKYCFDERGTMQIKTECQEYAAAYSRRMDGMVEDRMQASILSVASAWYTAWVDAGQPVLKNFMTENPEDDEEQKAIDKAFRQGSIFGRKH
jgi:hypothetical protein